MCVSVFMCLSVWASTVERESPPPRLSLSIGARQTSDDDGDRHRHTRGISGKEDGGGGGGGGHMDVPENLRQLAAAQPSQELASQELASQELASHELASQELASHELASHLQVLAAMMSPQAWYHISIFVLVIFL